MFVIRLLRPCRQHRWLRSQQHAGALRGAALHCLFAWGYLLAKMRGGRRRMLTCSVFVMRKRNKPVPSGHSAPMMMDSLTPTMSSVRPWIAASNKWSVRRAEQSDANAARTHVIHVAHLSSSQMMPA